MWFNIITICLLQLGTSLASPVPGPLAGAGEANQPSVITGPSSNQVAGAIDNVYDPSIVKGPDGVYTLVSSGRGIPIRHSTDRITWTEAGFVFPDGAPKFTEIYTRTPNGALLAPDISYHEGTFYLYYSAQNSTGAKNELRRSAIFLATSPTGLPGTWQDQGEVTPLPASTELSPITPNLAVDGDKWYLTVGNWGGGSNVFSLDPATHKAVGQSTEVAKTLGVAPPDTPTGFSVSSPPGAASPFLYQEGSFWYQFFMSWESETYNIKVVRGESPAGPFVDKNNVQALAGGGTLVIGTGITVFGPRNPSVWKDEENSFLAYQWLDKDGSTFHLGINQLNFTSGWPVAYTATALA